MITSTFENIKISGISCALPMRHIVNTEEYGERFGVETIQKSSAMTGICGGYVCDPYQTVSDLCFAAAKKMMAEKAITPESVDVLIFCSYNKDYFGPATAFVLQHRLGIPMDSVVFDMSMGCSGFIYGLQVMSSLLTCTSAKRGLLMVGDSTSKNASPLDKNRMLFGDAGAAILIEKEQGASPIHTALRSDGNRFKDIITPAGGDRIWDGASRERVEWADGNVRSDYDTYINGPDVFNFSITDVPRLLLDFMNWQGTMSADYDYLLLHQANLFIMKHLAKKVGFKMDKVPVSLDRYANSSGTTIPVTLCDAFGGKEARKLHLLMSGFGVGLSWGVASLDLDTAGILPIFHTDNRFTDGSVSHG